MSQSRTGSANQAVEHYYNGALAQTTQLVFTGQGNMYGFELENNDASSDVFVQFFDAAATADVTLGTTPPTFTFRIPPGANFGKDAQDLVLHFCSLGLVVACTSTRTGSSAPATSCAANVWHWAHK